MIKRTEKEVLDFCKKVWAEDYGRVDPPNFTFFDKDYYGGELKTQNIAANKMYEAPKLTLTELMKVARFFDTMNVDTTNTFYNSGCETCDHGSSAGWTLVIRDGPKPPAE